MRSDLFFSEVHPKEFSYGFITVLAYRESMSVALAPPVETTRPHGVSPEEWSYRQQLHLFAQALERKLEQASSPGEFLQTLAFIEECIVLAGDSPATTLTSLRVTARQQAAARALPEAAVQRAEMYGQGVGHVVTALHQATLR